MSPVETVQAPVKSDHTENIGLEATIKGMTKSDLIGYANENMGLTIDERLERDAIVAALLKIDRDKRLSAKTLNEQSLAMATDMSGMPPKVQERLADPPVRVRFHNAESPGVDLEFTCSKPRGFRGKKNKYGFKTCPRWHFYHGETYVIPYSIYEHLREKTFITHKAVFDPMTGNIAGSIPLIKPRFILEVLLTREQLLNKGDTK